jgi:hypothetical protein
MGREDAPDVSRAHACWNNSGCASPCGDTPLPVGEGLRIRGPRSATLTPERHPAPTGGGARGAVIGQDTPIRLSPYCLLPPPTPRPQWGWGSENQGLTRDTFPLAPSHNPCAGVPTSISGRHMPSSPSRVALAHAARRKKARQALSVQTACQKTKMHASCHQALRYAGNRAGRTEAKVLLLVTLPAPRVQGCAEDSQPIRSAGRDRLEPPRGSPDRPCPGRVDSSTQHRPGRFVFVFRNPP